MTYQKGFCDGYDVACINEPQLRKQTISMEWVKENVKADIFSTDIRSVQIGILSSFIAMSEKGMISIDPDLLETYKNLQKKENN